MCHFFHNQQSFYRSALPAYAQTNQFDRLKCKSFNFVRLKHLQIIYVRNNKLRHTFSPDSLELIFRRFTIDFSHIETCHSEYPAKMKNNNYHCTHQ